MARIGFIGLGNMGLPMARNLLKAGHQVTGFDLSKAAVEALAADKGIAGTSVADVCKNADFIVTMLPAGEQVRSLYLGDAGIVALVPQSAVLIDSSTIDVESARAVAAAAAKRGVGMIDAPVSGGVGGAAAGTLTFMVGGPDEAFAKAKPILEVMGKTIVHAGGAGNGQAAKICNNMILGISMIAVSEAFVLADKVGLDKQKLFDIASKASGQCWSLTSYCPEPGLVPASPANLDYQPGFTVAMMLKDLKLAQEAARAAGASTPLGAEAAMLYNLYAGLGKSGEDFSGIIRFLRGA
jgi:3-hydroxyisobutyrate dehydrogenase